MGSQEPPRLMLSLQFTPLYCIQHFFPPFSYEYITLFLLSPICAWFLLNLKPQSYTIQYNNLFKVVTQGVVAHSPEPGAHDKSARQLKIQN